MVWRTVFVRAPPPGGACCVGVWPPPWWGVLSWFVVPLLVGCAVLVRAPLMVGRIVSVCAPPPWWGVLRCFVTPLVVGRAVLVRAPPLCRACCVGPCPPRWWCVVWGVVIFWVGCGRGCVADLAGVGVVLVRAPFPAGACRVCACPPPWWGVLCQRVWVSVSGVLAGWMLGWFCCSAVLSAAVRPASSGVGCLWFLPGRGRFCAGACPPPLLGCAVLVRAPPLGGACCVGAWPPSCCGVLCWCPPAEVVVFGFGCRRLLGGLWLVLCCWLSPGWCCAGAPPPPPHVGSFCVCVWPTLGGGCCDGVFEFQFVVL